MRNNKEQMFAMYKAQGIEMNDEMFEELIQTMSQPGYLKNI